VGSLLWGVAGNVVAATQGHRTAAAGNLRRNAANEPREPPSPQRATNALDGIRAARGPRGLWCPLDGRCLSAVTLPAPLDRRSARARGRPPGHPDGPAPSAAHVRSVSAVRAVALRNCAPRRGRPPPAPR